MRLRHSEGNVELAVRAAGDEDFEIIRDSRLRHHLKQKLQQFLRISDLTLVEGIEDYDDRAREFDSLEGYCDKLL